MQFTYVAQIKGQVTLRFQSLLLSLFLVGIPIVVNTISNFFIIIVLCGVL